MYQKKTKKPKKKLLCVCNYTQNVGLALKLGVHQLRWCINAEWADSACVITFSPFICRFADLKMECPVEMTFQVCGENLLQNFTRTQ